MGGWRSCVACCIALGIAVSAPSSARADSAADARDLFTQARDLRAHGDCAHAVTLFRKAYELFPGGLGSLRNFAECEEALGQFSSARGAWIELKQGVLASTDKKYEGWNNDAEQAIERLAPKLASLTIDVKVAGTHGETNLPADGVVVTVNGEAVATPLFGTTLEHDPGTYVVHAGGARVVEPVEKSVQLNPSDAQHVELDVVVATELPPPPIAAQAPLPVTSPSDATSPPPRDHRKTQKALGWTALGVGAAGIVGAGITLAMRQAAIASVKSICGGSDSTCPGSERANVQSAVSRAQSTSTLFSVFGIVGLVGLGGGIVLLETVPSAPGTQASVVVGPGSIELGGEF
jgi:hypothetical protein